MKLSCALVSTTLVVLMGPDLILSATPRQQRAEAGKEQKVNKMRSDLNSLAENLQSRMKGPQINAGTEDFTLQNGLDILGAINSSDVLLEAWAKHIAIERDDPQPNVRSVSVAGLSCKIRSRSARRPSSVHRLRPGDIDVVAAMGDSLTAGFGSGAKFGNFWQYDNEYRGRSWSAGGQRSYTRGFTTLPNILRKFNPKLRGFSKGVLGSSVGADTDKRTKLNVATTSALTDDMYRQATRLVEKIHADPYIDMANDWKMLTIFIGGNNLCRYCEDAETHSAANYKAELTRALDYLKTNVPRLFVNMVEIFDIAPITELANFGENTIICSLILRYYNACPCGYTSDPDTAQLTNISMAYQQVTQELINSGRYEGKEDFTVVLQPMFREITPPLKNGSPDLSFFAQDCFHFSNKAHNRAGRNLWNTIIEPVGQKRTDWIVKETANCPTTKFLPTNMNSISKPL